MAFLVKDRVKDTTTTTGTGSVTLSGTAPTGFQNFNAAIGTSNTTYYCIAGQGTSEWEVGLGTLSASTTLARTTVYASSNAGSLVNFSAGTKDVFVTFPATVALRQYKYDLYTSGTATWTAPAGVTSINVVCIGGGGGGGSGIGGPAPGGNGGPGGLAVGTYTVTPGTGYSVTVGAGGAGNNTTGGNGSAGGSSSLGALISATGGGGGISASSTGADGASGAGSGGTFTTGQAIIGNSIYKFFGGVTRVRAVGTSAATTWSASSALLPGANGQGESDLTDDNAGGGQGGIIYIEYVG